MLNWIKVEFLNTFEDFINNNYENNENGFVERLQKIQSQKDFNYNRLINIDFHHHAVCNVDGFLWSEFYEY